MGDIPEIKNLTPAGQLAKKLDLKDCVADELINGSLWNSFIKDKGGQTIDLKDTINVEKAMLDIEKCLKEESKKSGKSETDLFNDWSKEISEMKVLSQKEKMATDKTQVVPIRTDNLEVVELDDERIVKTLISDIYAKNSLGLPTTGENFGEHMELITEDNVLNILNLYKSSNPDNETLFSAIMNEKGLSTEIRKKYLNQVIDKLLNYYEKKGHYVKDFRIKMKQEISTQMDKVGFSDTSVLDSFLSQLSSRVEGKAKSNISAPNGKIDMPIKQGKYGDCWFLSGIIGLSRTDKGRKILENSLKVNKDGSVVVTFKGVNKSYTISKEELERSTEYSNGDGDVRALEIACNKFLEETRGGSGQFGYKIDIKGNTGAVAFQLLTGKGWEHIYSDTSPVDKILNMGGVYTHNPTDEEINKIDDENTVTSVACHNLEKKDIVCKTTDGQTDILTSGHSYSVSRTDNYNVYLVNPWNSSRELIVDKKTFKDYFDYIVQIEV